MRNISSKNRLLTQTEIKEALLEEFNREEILESWLASKEVTLLNICNILNKNPRWYLSDVLDTIKNK